MYNGIERHCVYRRIPLLPAISQWSDSSLETPCRIPLVRIAGTRNSQLYIFGMLEPVVLPYNQCLSTAIFQQVNLRPHVARNAQEFFTHQIELLPWPACSSDLSPVETYGPCLRNDCSGIHHPLLYQINFDYIWKPHGLL
ncbi:hypothetical protein TNCV_3968811 [Trichonephila clavipes]|nr:hypothetical protein TNCV_3968811 [Trichonephila clavipes]